MKTIARYQSQFKCFLFCSALLFFLSFLVASEEAVQEERAQLQYKNDILNARMKLAKSGEFYLIADIPDRKIHLMMKNVSLKEYSIEDVEIGRRKFFFFPLLSSRMEAAQVFTGGAIYPSRVVKRYQIIPPEKKIENRNAMEEVPAAPEPPKEKEINVPHVFRLKFKGGFSLEIRSNESDQGSAGILSRILSSLRSKGSDLFAIFRRGGAFKVKCYLASEEMRSLYRSVPDDISMLLFVGPHP